MFYHQIKYLVKMTRDMFVEIREIRVIVEHSIKYIFDPLCIILALCGLEKIPKKSKCVLNH